MRTQRLITLLALTWLLGTAPSAVAHDDDHKTEGGVDTAICHVCRVHEGETDAEKVAATAVHDGHTYGFCSVQCRDKFVKDPVAYLPPVLPRPAPAFQAVDLEGATFSSESLQGKWILLDFWATWCPPCVADLPKLTELHHRYADRGFSVVSVSIDEGEKAAKKVGRMAKKRKAGHPILLDSTASPAWSAYQVRVVPTQFLISPEGQIVAQWSGTIDLAKVEAEVAAAFTD